MKRASRADEASRTYGTGGKGGARRTGGEDGEGVPREVAGFARKSGKVLEGRDGLATLVAVTLALLTAALAVVQWVVLPDEVVSHVSLSGEVNGTAPKWLFVAATAGFGLFGSAWFGFAREKVGLVIAAVGAVAGVIDLALNLPFS